MECTDPPLTGVGAPHQFHLGRFAMPPSLYTDVRSILMVLLAFKGHKDNLGICCFGEQGMDHNLNPIHGNLMFGCLLFSNDAF